MSRRGVTLLIAGIGVVLSLVAAWTFQVPYVALIPGPTYNTLGELNGKPVIQVSGHQTYPAAGHLNMVTISYIGGPGSSPPFTVFAALIAWLSPHEAVVPQSEIFPPGQSQQQVVKQDTQQMVGSQEAAQAAAMCQLNIEFTTVYTVSAVVKGMPAAGVLRPGDRIVAIDGRLPGCGADAAALIRSRPAGATVVLTIMRKGSKQRVALRTASYQGQPVIGVNLTQSYIFPFKIKISIGNIGGPSAGLMFSLGIIDKLTPGNLAGGAFIAGTGEISPGGTVGPIGGIQQKMAGARAAGATVFLTPAANCRDAAGEVPAGMRLIKVSTLSGAITALRALRQHLPVPSC